MDFKRLSLLRELADRGTVGATAEALGITASAVSQQLKVLQEELGVALVEKAGRGVRLTEAGRAMAEAAADVATAMARAESTVEGYRQGRQRRVSVAFFPSAAEMFLPGLLHRAEAIPGLSLDTSLHDPASVGFIDLAADYELVLAHSIDGAEFFARRGLVVESLLEEPLDVGLPIGHPLASREVLRAEDVVGESWVGVPPGFPFDIVLRQIELQAGQMAHRVQLMPDLRVMEALVRTGHGLSLLPRFTSRAGRHSGLVLRPLEGVQARRSIVVLARKEVAARSTVAAVLQMLRDEAVEVAAAGEPG